MSEGGEREGVGIEIKREGRCREREREIVFVCEIGVGGRKGEEGR